MASVGVVAEAAVSDPLSETNAATILSRSGHRDLGGGTGTGRGAGCMCSVSEADGHGRICASTIAQNCFGSTACVGLCRSTT